MDPAQSIEETDEAEGLKVEAAPAAVQQAQTPEQLEAARLERESLSNVQAQYGRERRFEKMARQDPAFRSILTERDELKKKLAAAEEAGAGFKLQAAEFKGQLQALEATIADLRKTVIDPTVAENGSLKSANAALSSDLSSVRAQLDTANSNLESARASERKLSELLSSEQSAHASTKETLGSAQARIEQLEKELSAALRSNSPTNPPAEAAPRKKGNQS